MSDAHAIDAGIRAVLAAHARLPQPVDRLAAPADLFQAGMSSHASVDVMLALEEAFAIEFPDEMLTRQVFGSIAGIRQALLQLGVQ
ncbi:acyl carrier protein [Eleftheria terrae]|uniref:acyl carrier protein n=1 Tax=Eleftheria terrae TaxID=1597781 RepID=UPI00263B3AA6|nr:acyl carrier protein [Eleftheria terrae]WKB53376.1 acyl carrier protein [Eleftheria terrae]